MKKNPSIDGLLSAPEVAKLLGIHIKTLYRKIRNKEISLKPVITKTEQRRRIKFRAREVEQYIEQHQEADDRAKLREKTRFVYVPTWPVDPDKAEEFFGEPAPRIDE